MSVDQEVLIKYNIDEIFACRNVNCLMSKELEPYCSNKYKSHMNMLVELLKPMDDITKSHSRGINPNDVTLKNMIRDSLNKINHLNYDSILNDLKSFSYTCENHFALLASELIIKSMNDVMACKGIEPNKNGQKTPSETYVSVACEFSNYMIKQIDKPIAFQNVLSKECQKYFVNLMDKKERMDQHNPHRVSNYKGFMNMMGLMYSYGIFPKDIILMCLDKTLKMILESDLPQDDSDNYYSGYERLMNRVLCHFERDQVTPQLTKQFNEIKNPIKQFNDKISRSCDDEYIKKINAPHKPIRMFSIMTHQQNVNRYTKLCNVYPSQ